MEELMLLTRLKEKSFHTTQGFKVVVKQETGEMELVGKIGDSDYHDRPGKFPSEGG